MKKVISIFLILILVSCSKVGRFGTGVDVTFDPRTIGMYIDDKIMEKNLSVRDAENMVKTKQSNQPKKRKALKNKDHQRAPIENKLIEILGTKVKLKASKKGGKIEISYFSLDDLDRIIDIISS